MQRHSEERLLFGAGPIAHASLGLRNDRAFMLQVVGLNGRALLHGSDAVRDDYEVAMTAVLQNGGALEHVSDRLRSDREIVDAAVRENRLAARFASTEFVESMDALELDDLPAAFEPRDD